MPNIRFPAPVNENAGFHQTLYERLGTRAIWTGREWEISGREEKRLKAKKPLTLHQCMPIGDLKQVARWMEEVAPVHMDEFYQEYEGNIDIPKGFGALTKIYQANVNLLFTRRRDLQKRLTEEFLPILMDELKPTHVTAITADSVYQQSISSTVKIALLINRHGVDKAKILSTQSEVLHGVLPNPISILSYPDVFTALSPHMISLSVWWNGCTWHFFRENGWHFPYPLANSFLDRFILNMHPGSSHSSAPLLFPVWEMDADETWRYLRAIVSAINSILSFTNNFFNFERDGEVDLLTQVQSMSALSFLFADLKGISSTTQAYNRNAFALSALDKLANIRNQLGGHNSKDEGALFRSLLSLKQGKNLRRIFDKNITPYWPHVGSALKRSTNVFAECHKGIRAQLKERGISERARLDQIWALRNLRHGTFLRRQQFENLFVDTPGEFPPGLASVALMLTLGMALSPEDFFAQPPL